MNTALAWQIAVAVGILVISVVIGSWLEALATAALARSTVDPMVRRLLSRLVRPLVVLVGAIAAVQYLNIDLTPITAMLGAATLAVGLALQSSLSNVASGALLLTLRPFKAGDLVDVGGSLGTVTDQTFFHVVLDAPDGRVLTLPNNAVFSSVIENFTRSGSRRIELSVTLSFDADVVSALSLLHAMAASHEGVLAEPPPAAITADLSARGPVVTLRAWCAHDRFVAVKSALAVSALQALRDASIPIAPPPLVP
jgi:small conductance mechanosensitive channel